MSLHFRQIVAAPAATFSSASQRRLGRLYVRDWRAAPRAPVHPSDEPNRPPPLSWAPGSRPAITCPPPAALCWWRRRSGGIAPVRGRRRPRGSWGRPHNRPWAKQRREVRRSDQHPASSNLTSPAAVRRVLRGDGGAREDFDQHRQHQQDEQSARTACRRQPPAPAAAALAIRYRSKTPPVTGRHRRRYRSSSPAVAVCGRWRMALAAISADRDSSGSTKSPGSRPWPRFRTARRSRWPGDTERRAGDPQREDTAHQSHRNDAGRQQGVAQGAEIQKEQHDERDRQRHNDAQSTNGLLQIAELADPFQRGSRPATAPEIRRRVAPRARHPRDRGRAR